MPPFRIDVHVFDIKQKKKYQQKGREKHLNAITEQALSRFLAGRPSQVVATAPTEPGQAKNISQDVSAGAPSERISLPPGGSVQAIKAAATAYCGTLNKQSRLIAAPPDHPEYVFGCYPPTEAVSTPTPSPTTVAKAAPTIGQGTTTPYKIAILPWKILATWNSQQMDQIVFAGTEQAISGQSNRIRLEYSFHRAFPAASQSKVIDKGIVSKQVAKKIWKGSKPNLDLVIDVGKKLGVNGVLLCRVRVEYASDDIGCYAIDLSSKQSFKVKRTTTGFTYEGEGAVQSAIEEALEKMLSAGSAWTPGSKVAAVFG
ncbi:MAG: hypothetical protein O7B27_12595, partial [Gammaproteobacteria bacterium]|nr:hypothetical protein [Gammaproteobacteria bacterium]